MVLHKVALAAMLTVGALSAQADTGNVTGVLKTDTGNVTGVLNGSKGNKLAQIDDVLTNKIKPLGFAIVQANKDIQNFYYQKFKEKNVQSISFYDMSNLKAMRSLLLKNPDFGAYTPFNYLVYKTLDKKTDDNTWYGHLTADTMLDIIGEKDPANRKEFEGIVSKLDAMVTKEMKPTEIKKFTHTKPVPANGVSGLTKMVKKFDKPEDMEEFVEDFVMDHDVRFGKHNFIIAGFDDIKFDYSDMDLAFDKYDAYWVSLLCHFKFSNSIFNHGVPQAGMFAPCSVYFYIPKGKNELHMGYASVNNWINGLDFKDEKRIKYMKAIDAEVVDVFKEMGFEKE